MDPSKTNLLICQGVTEGDSSSFQFVFNIPKHASEIHTLRSGFLWDQTNTYSVSERVNVTRSLVGSIIFLHQAHFVHKTIRPETALICKTEEDRDVASPVLGTPFLIGFEELRDEDNITSLKGDDRRERNIYRHPLRQGVQAQVKYIQRALRPHHPY
ncbi:hypothetical protein SLS55_003653 [Diplodia seriata]|uniref:Protein kinase domain-containing protein n=1 Tax=Diplodia seriata TaxID=420778 RepID=A0ABR3CNI7_9PEZI